MYVKVDLGSSPAGVTLEEPDDVKRFHLTVVGGDDRGAVAAALSGSGTGRLEGDHAWVNVDAVRRMAAGRVGASWEDDFRGMVEFARTKGWLDEGGSAIQAHLEWG